MREAMQAGLDALNESRDDVVTTLDGYQYGAGARYDRLRIAIVTEQLEKHDAAIAQLEASLAAPESKSNTMAGFRGGFIGLHGRAPTEQEIWNAGVDSGRRRYAAPDPVAEFASQQRPLDADMSKVLHDNLWDLYEAAPVPAIAAPVEPIESEPTQTDKQAWWAGYRAGKGLPPDTPRQDAIAAPVAGMVISDAEILEAGKEALSEFGQHDDYLLAHGASLMSSDSHEIVHVDTVARIARAIIAKVEGK